MADSSKVSWFSSPALTLYWLLEVCAEQNVEPPKNTKHITCDEMLCIYLASKVLAFQDKRIPMALGVVMSAYDGLPVKQVFHLVPYALKRSDIVSRDIYLQGQARKREVA
jgi:hypothetical protein